MKIITNVSGTIACSLIIFGSLFKILHLRGANELLVVGITLLAGIYIPSLAIYWYRKL